MSKQVSAQELQSAVLEQISKSHLANAHDIAPNGVGDMECRFLGEAQERIAIGSSQLLPDCYQAALLLLEIGRICKHSEVRELANRAGNEIQKLVKNAWSTLHVA